MELTMRWFKSRCKAKFGSKSRHPVELDVAAERATKPVSNRFRTGASPDAHRRKPNTSSAARPRYFRPIEHVDAVMHARALLELLQQADYPDGYMITFAELYKIYVEMCESYHWRLQGWVKVGKEFDLLTTNGAKPYATFFDEDGRARRLRVYPIPVSKLQQDEVDT